VTLTKEGRPNKRARHAGAETASIIADLPGAGRRIPKSLSYLRPFWLSSSNGNDFAIGLAVFGSRRSLPACGTECARS